MTSPDNLELGSKYILYSDLPPMPKEWTGDANERTQQYFDNFVADITPKTEADITLKAEQIRAFEMYTRYQKSFATMISDPGSFNDNYATPESDKKGEQFSAFLEERDQVLENPKTSQAFKDAYGLIERIGSNLVIARRRSLGEKGVDHSSKYMGNENQIVANVSVALALEAAAKKLKNPINPQPEASQPKQVFKSGK